MSIFGNIAYGLQVAAIGLVVVFLGLTILICAVTLMGKIMKSATARKEAKARAAATAVEVASAAPDHPTLVLEPELGMDMGMGMEDVTDNSELIAVIAAAIAAFDNSGKSLVVRRVRRVAGWKNAARAEQIMRF
ncbi:MAG: OadG family protein [bacterium]